MRVNGLDDFVTGRFQFPCDDHFGDHLGYVGADEVGTQARGVGDWEEEVPLFSNTLGLRLVGADAALWPAYASPRPRQ